MRLLDIPTPSPQALSFPSLGEVLANASDAHLIYHLRSVRNNMLKHHKITPVVAHMYTWKRLPRDTTTIPSQRYAAIFSTLALTRTVPPAMSDSRP